MQKRQKLWLAMVLAAVLAAYANSFHNSFHFDDFHTVVDNPAIRTLKNVPRFFTDATTFSVLPANRTYRPFVSTSLAVDYMLGRGYVPLWFHVGTFCLFLLLVVLLARWFALMFARVDGAAPAFWMGLGAAAWFGLHPAMAETVNYVIQRGDLYCTLGCVGALYCWARWPERRKFALYLLPFAFALLSKPPAAVFPLLLFFYCGFFGDSAVDDAGKNAVSSAPLRNDKHENMGRLTATWKRAAVAAAPSLAVTAALLWLQSAMTPKTFLPSMISPWDYRLTQPFVWARYCAELFLPLHLNADSDLTPVNGLDGRALLGLLFLAGLAAAIVWTARRPRLFPIAYGLIWFVLTEVPTSAYPLSEVENDHRMFFSFPGLMLAVVWAGWLGWRRLGESWKPKSQNRDVGLPLRWLRAAVAAALLVSLSAYAYGTHRRNAVWHDEESLWKDDAAKSPHNGRGLMNYGLALMNRGAYPQALATFQEALKYTPNYSALEINLGVVCGALADAGDASKAVEAEQHFVRAIQLSPGDDAPSAFYGRWLSDHGRYGEALYQLQRAVKLNPDRPFQRDLLIATNQRAAGGVTTSAQPTAQDLVNQSMALGQAGKFEESIAAARKALALDPKSAEAWNNISAAAEAEHNWDAAIDAAHHAIALRPDFQLARNNLAWSQAQKKLGVR